MTPLVNNDLDFRTSATQDEIEILTSQEDLQEITPSDSAPTHEDSVSIDMQEDEDSSQHDLSEIIFAATHSENEDLVSGDSQESRDSVIQQSFSIQPANINAENPMNAVISYYLNGKGSASLKRELLKQSGLFFISSLGVMFYYEPTKKYAESICADPHYKNIPCSFFINNHVAGTLLVAGGILMVATNAFIDEQNASYIPDELKAYLKSTLTRKQKTIENIVTFIGSFVASVPFIIITVVNPIPNLPKFLLFSQACIVGLTNTLLHLLPFKLAFKNKLYRAPFLPLEFMVQRIINSFLNPEEKRAKKLNARINQNYQILKQGFVEHIDQVKRLLNIYGFKFSGLGYTNEVIDDIRAIQDLNYPPLELLAKIFEYAHSISPDQSMRCPGRINNFFNQLVAIPGAAWVILACAGFCGSTFNEISRLTGSHEYGALVSAPSIYCLIVLLAFFGKNAAQNLFAYLTDSSGVKISLPFKLYPKTSLLLLMISMYLSVFSYAAGAQLINDNFNEELRPYLLEIARTGLIFLGFNAMIDLLISGVSKSGKYAGKPDAQASIMLFEAFMQIINGLHLMRIPQYLESLASMDVNLLKTIHNIRTNSDQEKFSETLIQLAKDLKTKLFFNYESKIIDLTENDSQFVKLLLQVQNDPFYSLDKSEELSAYLSNLKLEELPLSLEDCQNYRNICKIMQTLDSANLTRESRNESTVSITTDEGYAGPSTETTHLIPSIGRPIIGSIQSIFFHPPRPPQFYADGGSRPAYSQIL